LFRVYSGSILSWSNDSSIDMSCRIILRSRFRRSNQVPKRYMGRVFSTYRFSQPVAMFSLSRSCLLSRWGHRRALCAWASLLLGKRSTRPKCNTPGSYRPCKWRYVSPRLLLRWKHNQYLPVSKQHIHPVPRIVICYAVLYVSAWKSLHIWKPATHSLLCRWLLRRRREFLLLSAVYIQSVLGELPDRELFAVFRGLLLQRNGHLNTCSCSL